MARLIYLTIASLDGYMEDADGKFDWAVPDDAVHQFVNDLARGVGTYLYGRSMYATMAVWETEPEFASESPILQDFAEIWQAAEKVVYSRTLQAVVTSKTKLERDFDPRTIRQMKAAAGQDLMIGGAALAGHALVAGLIDQVDLILAPVLVGGGKRALPEGVRQELALLEERRFDNGMIYLSYQVR